MPTKTRLDDRRWEVCRGSGPVLATAVHAGHDLRDELRTRSALSADERLREEDPLTDVLASVGDHTFVSRTSRFEVDLNRPTEEAVYRVPSDAWGLELWDEEPNDEMVALSLEQHCGFYAGMRMWIEELIAEHGQILLLDVHSFNHRRENDDGERVADPEMPDIDLGLSTADSDRFGPVVDALWTGLSDIRIGGEAIDVRENVRFPDGGNWPEWVFAQYGDHVCTITLEYKKIFMDEWTGHADIATLLGLHAGLSDATAAARAAIS